MQLPIKTRRLLDQAKAFLCHVNSSFGENTNSFQIIHAWLDVPQT